MSFMYPPPKFKSLSGIIVMSVSDNKNYETFYTYGSNKRSASFSNGVLSLFQYLGRGVNLKFRD